MPGFSILPLSLLFSLLGLNIVALLSLLVDFPTEASQLHRQIFFFQMVELHLILLKVCVCMCYKLLHFVHLYQQVIANPDRRSQNLAQ